MNDIRGRASDSLTTDYAWNIGKALAEWLPQDGDVIVCGTDTTNATTMHALTEGVLLQGRDVIDAATTSQADVGSLIREAQAAGGVCIAHDDLQDMEIITLFDAQGAPITADSGLTELRELIEAGNFLPAPVKGEQKQLS